MSINKPQVAINEDYEKLYGFHVPEHFVFKAKPGLTEEGVKEISWMKSEPEWMLRNRLRAYQHFMSKPMPIWANTELLNSIHFDKIYYYLKPTEKRARPGKTCRRRSRRRSIAWASPRRSASFSRGCRRNMNPSRCTTPCTRIWRSRA